MNRKRSCLKDFLIRKIFHFFLDLRFRSFLQGDINLVSQWVNICEELGLICFYMFIWTNFNIVKISDQYVREIFKGNSDPISSSGPESPLIPSEKEKGWSNIRNDLGKTLKINASETGALI